VVVARCPENRYFNELPHWKGLKFTWHTKNIRPHGGAMPTIREEEEEEVSDPAPSTLSFFLAWRWQLWNSKWGTGHGAGCTAK